MTIESTSSIVGNVSDKLNLFINVLGVFSTILLGIFSILAVILGFLVWKHEDMRKKAQEELKQIESLSAKISAIYEHLGLLVEVAQAETSLITARNDRFAALLENAKGETKKITGVREEMEKMKSETALSANSLATISKFMPSLSPSASPSLSPSPDYDSALKIEAMKERLAQLTGKVSGSKE